jgi:hypothetical protein
MISKGTKGASEKKGLFKLSFINSLPFAMEHKEP